MRWTPFVRQILAVAKSGAAVLYEGKAIRDRHSIPDLTRRSGRIPALPYPPIKRFYYTAMLVPAGRQKVHPGQKAINPSPGDSQVLCC